MDIDGKLRPLYLLRILREQTDENHKLSTAQLCKLLKDEYGIDTFRTTIKTDIEVLQQATALKSHDPRKTYTTIKSVNSIHRK